MGILATTGNCNCLTSLGLIKRDPESRKTRVEIFLSLRLRMSLAVGVADGGKETGEAVLIEVTLVGACVTVGFEAAG